MKKFALSEIQTIAILDLQLKRLAALERQKILDELKEVQKTIKYLLNDYLTEIKIIRVL